MAHTDSAAPRVYRHVAAALMLLLAATIGVSYLPLGALALAAALVIAAVKAGLVAIYFMHLRHENPLVRLFAFAGLSWLIILLGLTLFDYLTRGVADDS